MHFEPGEPYHIYNRGNNRQPIFFNARNYLFFLGKVKKEWTKYGSILTYCLMPNHFHFIMLPNELACSPAPSPQNGIPMQMLSRQIGITLSSYTKAINNQNSSCGNLFQKKTKAKCLSTGSVETPDMNSLGYLLTCFLYIHENPLKAGLVNELKDWEYSSWADYAGLRNSGICDRQKLLDLIGLSMQECNFQNRLMNENVGIGAGIGQAT